MNLKEVVEAKVKSRREWLEEALKAQELVNLLPEELPNLPAVHCDINSGELDLIFTGAEAAKVLKLTGVIGLKSSLSWGNHWSMVGGTLQLPGGIIAQIDISETPQPEDCHVEEYTETITRHKAVCNKTGKEI